MEFRKLKADEVTCRVAMVKQNGVSLLLYKDARVDMNILDETVGSMNWQKEYRRDNANCVVSIWDSEKNQWISKEDTGTESQTEAEKGLASDAFKRACFNWGIGRELYTAPFIWVNVGDCEIKQSRDRYKCYDKFTVTEIGYDDAGRINRLAIENAKTHRTVYTFGKAQNYRQEPQKPKTITRAQAKELTDAAKAKGMTAQAIMEYLDVSRMGEITQNQFGDALVMLNDLK